MNRFFRDKKTLEHMKSGPLGLYIDRYADQLEAEGYARYSASHMLRLVTLFSQWLETKGVLSREITPQHVTDYLRARKRVGYQPGLGDSTTLIRMLKLLNEDGVIGLRDPKPSPTPSEKLLKQYDAYLAKEQCLALNTRISYHSFVGKFVADALGKGLADLPKLRATDVIKHVQFRAKMLKPKCAQLMTTALRSFLRFAQYRGKLALNLVSCVPSVASWSLSTVPRALPDDHVKRVLVACNRKTATGKRDYAILLLLARLGLRSGEVARLKLEDIDWEGGYITIRGKAGRVDPMPLPTDVGKALAAYLREGRPKTSGNRFLFLRARAPLVEFKDQQSVGAVVKYALRRAGIHSPRNGAHQFRHSLASKMLRKGCSLSEIGEILRHQSQNTTAIYAKVDLPSLRTLALPWPRGGR
jgi:site-specific recombinase XerD